MTGQISGVGSTGAIPLAVARPPRAALHRRELALLVAAFVLIAVGASLAVVVSRHNRAAASGYETLTPSGVVASSQLAGHPASAAGDDDTTTYWSPSAPGVGQSITFDYATPETFSAVAVLDGDQATPGAFSRVARAKTVRLTFSSGAGTTVTLADVPTFQEFTIPPQRSDLLRLQILSVYPGTTGAPPAISDVFAYTGG